MLIRIAERRKSKIKLALQGPAGSGKTLSSLLLSLGLTGNLSKVCIIDTENGSSDLYSHLGDYSVFNIGAPYTPEKYIEAIDLVHKAGFQVIIIDSISHSWEYLLDYHASLTGNSFTNWSKITPRHNAFIQSILTTPVHIIATMRTKQDYVLNQKGDGKFVPEKVGLKSIQRDGTDYEFTTVFDLDIKHFVSCSKDRTGMFMDQVPFVISADTGVKILKWCNEGVSLDFIVSKIKDAKSIGELTEVYKLHQQYYPELEDHFKERKLQLLQPKSAANGRSNY